ncbi:MAG TPA: hypothetical protein PKL77_06165 [Candidatus Omnitrophota bacterium]|nr:hypothetical protein [Candidatus Omnitrophota bacterium]
MNCPCKDCQSREVSCHGKCVAYAAYREEIGRILQNRIADNDRYLTAARKQHLKDNLKYKQACFLGQRR